MQELSQKPKRKVIVVQM